MLACVMDKPEVVKVLLDYGAIVTQKEEKLDKKYKEKLNSLELAIENGRRNIIIIYVGKSC